MGLWLLLLLSFFSPSIFSATAERGEVLYQNCISCHGEKGEGGIEHKTPIIAGQLDWYIASSIKDFQEGKSKKHPWAETEIKGLSKEDILHLALYVMGLKL